MSVQKSTTMLSKIFLVVLFAISSVFATADEKIEYVRHEKKIEIVQAIEEEIVKEVTVEKVELLPGLKPICACESTGNRDGEPRQFKSDGSVLRGVVNSDDIGQCQINLKYHGEAAEKLGIDLFTNEGNIQYANLLYIKEGARPWSWSKNCHGQ